MLKTNIANSKNVFHVNQMQVLNAIILSKEPISRIDISRQLGLSKASVSNIITDLIEKKLVFEFKKGKSTNKGGKKPILIDVYPKRFFLSMSLTETRFLYKLTDLKGNTVQKNEFTFRAKTDFLKTIVKFFDFVKDEIKSKSVVAGCLVLPGVIDSYEKSIVYSGIFDVVDFKMASIFTKFFKFPVYIENDANAWAVSEKYLENIQLKDYILFALGGSTKENTLYVGTGVVIHDQLVRGSHNFGGEFFYGSKVQIDKTIKFVNKKWIINKKFLKDIIEKIVGYTFFLNPQTIFFSPSILDNDGALLNGIKEEFSYLESVYRGFTIDIKISELEDGPLSGGIGVLIDKIIKNEINLLEEKE